MTVKERSGNNVTVECNVSSSSSHTLQFCYNDVPTTNNNDTRRGSVEVYSFIVSKSSEGRYECCCSVQCETCSGTIFLGEPCAALVHAQ